MSEELASRAKNYFVFLYLVIIMTSKNNIRNVLSSILRSDHKKDGNSQNFLWIKTLTLQFYSSEQEMLSVQDPLRDWPTGPSDILYL